MELSFVYDSAHFAPFAQPSDDASRALNRVTIEPSVAGFAQEANTALNAAEDKLKHGETMEAVKLYLAASRAYLRAAEGVNSEQTALMLIFLSNSITRKIEGLRAQIASGSSTGSPDFGRPAAAASHDTESETPPLTEQHAGRLTFEGVRSKLRQIDKVPEAISQPSAVEDMLALERRLAELGLVQGRAPMESVSAAHGYASGTLGESFYVLGRNTSMAEFAPIGSDDLTASKGASRRFDMKPPVMRRTISTEAKVKGAGNPAAAPGGAVDPLSLSVYPTKALADVPDATLAASVNFSIGPNAGYANNENISRLLHAMDRLSKENEALLKEREIGIRYMEENRQLRRQTQEFKKLYDEKFAKLKKVLHDFAAHYPTENNPANDVHKSEKEKLQRRVVELEKVVKTLLARVDSQKKQIEADRAAMAKKDDLIQRYERVFKEIKDRHRQKQDAASSSGGQRPPHPQPSQPQPASHPQSMPPPQAAPAPHHRVAPLQQPPEMMRSPSDPTSSSVSPSAASHKMMPYNPPRAAQRTAPRPSTSTMASLSSSGIAGQQTKAKMQAPPRPRS